jgi:putative ABC transport system permease protein
MSVSAGKMLARDWRSGELTVLIIALVLAVTVVVGISAFTSRLQGALEQESHRFLAADLVVASGRDLPASWREEAQALNLNWAQTLQFPSMLFAGEEYMALASVKAVSAAYPLRGALQFSAEPFAAGHEVDDGPEPGTVWLDSRLFALLQVATGDRVGIGEAEFTVAGSIRAEPDQATAFSPYGPRVLMHIDDIPATKVVQPGSRVQYRQLFAGEAQRVAQWRNALEPQLTEGQRLVDVADGQQGIGGALTRAEQFLLLAGSLAVVLAAVAIALAARRFSERHIDVVAILKSLGATTATVSGLYGRALAALGLVAALIGCLLGWAVQALFFSFIAEQLPVAPGPAGSKPFVTGAATALVCLLCFAWPPLQRLANSSPLRVLRRDLPSESRRSAVDFALGLAAITGLMWWYSRDLALTLAVLSGLALSLACGLILAFTLLRGGRAVGMRAGSIWRLALAGLQRRGGANAMQVVVFGMAFMLLLVMLLVRTSLLEQWQNQLPAGAPNHFLLNVAPAEVDDIEHLLAERELLSDGLYPMVRGRVMAINDELLPADDVDEDGDGEEDHERHQRESNLTWADALPAGNELLAGRWWTPGEDLHQVSVESGYAEHMELALGDKLSLLIGSQPLEATVTSIRELDWQSLQPNFFLVFPPGLLEQYPATFMTSFHLPAQDKLFLNEFVRRFPTVTVIEMDAVVDQVQRIVAQVSAAIELVLLIILATGALVLVAGVQASVDARMHESAILRALGARRGLLLGALAIEFAAMGLFAGVLAVLAAELTVYLLQVYVIDMAYQATPWLWPLGVLAAVVLITVLGVLACRKVVSTPPLRVLREL